MPAREEVEGAAARDDVAGPIRSAWAKGDGWLRACAVRASRHSPSLDPELFRTGDVDDPIVKAELAALTSIGERVLVSSEHAVATEPAEGTGC